VTAVRLQARTTLLLGMLLLSACNRVDNYSDLQAFVNDARLRPGAEVEPVPEFTPYEGFVYSAASMRSPFQEPMVVDNEEMAGLSQDVQPDFDRPREELESHPLSELNMAGMLVRGGEYQALIEDALLLRTRSSISASRSSHSLR